MAEYKATLRAWADVYGMSGPGSPLNQCLLELRDRIEALEANVKADQRETFPTLDRALRNSDKLDRLIAQDRDDAPVAAGSLVERVSCAIDGRINPDQWLHQDAARSAIREVAAWLREQQDGDLVAAAMLEQEADR